MEYIFPAGATFYGMSFQYHMYGATIGHAELESSANGTVWSPLWSMTGNQGQAWSLGSAYAPAPDHSMVRFTYVHIGRALHAGVERTKNRH